LSTPTVMPSIYRDTQLNSRLATSVSVTRAFLTCYKNEWGKYIFWDEIMWQVLCTCLFNGVELHLQVSLCVDIISKTVRSL